MVTRLLQGMPLQRSLRAVLLATHAVPQGALPQVTLRRRRDAVGIRVELRPLGLGTRLLPAVRAHRYQPYHLLAEGLDPDTEYDWEVPTVPIWRARTLPAAMPSTGLSMLVGSCYYDYFHRGSMIVGAAYEIAKRERVAFGMLVGDNLYLDVAPDQRAYSDAFKETAERYTQYFYRSPYHQLLSVCSSLTTWDDHEFWNNYPDSQIHLSRSWSWNAAEYDQAAQEAISIFQEPLQRALRERRGTARYPRRAAGHFAEGLFCPPAGGAPALLDGRNPLEYLSTWDEYSPGCGGNCWQCGHSNMANPWGPQNNFCYHCDNGSLQDHNFDRTPGTTPTSQPPAWSSANSQLLTPWIPFETPDNYDYRDFSFDGYVSHVYRH